MAANERAGPYTVTTPKPLPAVREGEHWWLEHGGRRLRLSNLDKPYWPHEGYTKGDLLSYYWNVAELILPYLEGRPLTLKRMPDGAEGPFFYEKNAPSHTPDWVRRCAVPGDEPGGRVIDFVMADDPAALLFVANLGCIEFHPLHSRCASIAQPDYLFFDLDPFPPASFSDVLAVAHHVHAALAALGLPSYPKTSGATGLQIYVPIRPGHSYAQVREFVGTVGLAIREADPERVTLEWQIPKRKGKVFIDHNMNRQGANIAAAYSLRPEPGAPVSTPLSWDEVAAGEVRPQDFTIATVYDRLQQVGDLFAPVVSEAVDISEALGRLGLRDSPDLDTDTSGALATYQAKRDFRLTPEPGARPQAAERGEAAPSRGNRFVIQKHDATRLHYDLRLERNGVMASWAVPKGLPTTPGDRRLAVQTEDHPLEYASFEGWIPEGQYGAGEVRVFDSGSYEPLEWTEDKVTFRLQGRRHRGEYHLVRTKQGWLIFLSTRSAGPAGVEPPAFSPMLAEGGHLPFDDPAWRFEPKLDGVRTLAHVTTAATVLWSRRGRDQTAQYPELSSLARWVNARDAVIDGEIVALEEGGSPSFELLQQRINLSSEADIERIRGRTPVTLFAFDVLWLDGEELTRLPLTERRRRLEEIVTEAGPLKLTLYRDGKGVEFFDAVRHLGLEGMVAKRLESRYLPGRRSSDWRKVKAVRSQDCVILGWTKGTGSRSATIGALLVGAYRGEELLWVGNVGTGFTDRLLEDLCARLEAVEADEPPLRDPELRRLKDARFTRPELVCEVEYLEITKAGKLRAPSFKGLRPDKLPADCQLEQPAR